MSKCSACDSRSCTGACRSNRRGMCHKCRKVPYVAGNPAKRCQGCLDASGVELPIRPAAIPPGAGIPGTHRLPASVTQKARLPAGQVLHFGGKLEPVPTQSTTGSKAFQSGNHEFLSHEVSHTSSSDPMKGYNEITHRGFRADEYPPTGFGKPSETPSTGSSQRSIINSVKQMGHPQTAEEYRKAVKAAKAISTPDNPIEGKPYYERDRYYEPPGMMAYKRYKDVEDERKKINKPAAASHKAAPVPLSNNHDAELSRVAAADQKDLRDACIRVADARLDYFNDPANQFTYNDAPEVKSHVKAIQGELNGARRAHSNAQNHQKRYEEDKLLADGGPPPPKPYGSSKSKGKAKEAVPNCSVAGCPYAANPGSESGRCRRNDCGPKRTKPRKCSVRLCDNKAAPGKDQCGQSNCGLRLCEAAGGCSNPMDPNSEGKRCRKDTCQGRDPIRKCSHSSCVHDQALNHRTCRRNDCGGHRR